MQELFKKALRFVLKWEGGYSNNPNDLGGATNYGITQATYNQWRYLKDFNLKNIKDISENEVAEIYYNEYWLRAECDKMTPKFAVLVFDTAVNMGLSRAKEFLKAAEYKYTEKFIEAREEKYREFARYGGQHVFLKGWLNRLNDLKTFVEKL
jgi:lysozyme family protein